MDIQVMASGSTGNCYLIDDRASRLLLDAGIPIEQIQISCGFSMSCIAGCLLTHCHMDHAKAVQDLCRFGVDVYTSQGTKGALRVNSRHLRTVHTQEPIHVGSYTVLPFDAEHDAPEPLGYLIQSRNTREKLLYLTDSYFVRYTFSGLTHILIECNYDEAILQANIESGRVSKALARRVRQSHMSLQQLLEMLRANDLSQVRQIYLLHVSRDNGDPIMFKRAVQAATGKEVYVCQKKGGFQ